MEHIIKQFYSAFNELDAERMVALYHDDVHFEDPGFGILKGERAKNMWRMLVASQQGKKFTVTHSDVQASDDVGSAHWEAIYQFSKTGRWVHNKIDAEFEFKDGKIIRHIDTFNLYRWSRQALGIAGYLIGWTSSFRNKFQAQTKGMLDKFEAKRS